MNGIIRIVGITKPVFFEKPEELISYCARVSSPKNQENMETAPKLLRYCIRNKHWSVFEMCNVIVEINTTRDISHQIIRHRSFSFQEFSGRYAEYEDDLVIREARLQDKKNRQNSIEFDDEEIKIDWSKFQTRVARVAKFVYNWAIRIGIAKELARAILPEGMVPTRLYMNGNLRSWIHYIEVRATKETQKEHRIIAEAVKSLLSKEFEFLREYFSEEEKNSGLSS